MIKMMTPDDRNAIREVLHDLVSGKGFTKKYPNIPLSPRTDEALKTIESIWEGKERKEEV
jgi:hypothetical protein